MLLLRRGANPNAVNHVSHAIDRCHCTNVILVLILILKLRVVCIVTLMMVMPMAVTIPTISMAL